MPSRRYHNKSERRRYHRALARTTRGQRLPPKIPIGRQHSKTNRDEAFFELERSVGFPKIQLLEDNPNAQTIFRVDPTAKNGGGHIKHDDRAYVTRRGYRAHAPDERVRRFARRHEHADGLVRNRPKQRYRQQSVNDEQKGGHADLHQRFSASLLSSRRDVQS